MIITSYPAESVESEQTVTSKLKTTSPGIITSSLTVISSSTIGNTTTIVSNSGPVQTAPIISTAAPPVVNMGVKIENGGIVGALMLGFAFLDVYL